MSSTTQFQIKCGNSKITQSVIVILLASLPFHTKGAFTGHPLQFFSMKYNNEEENKKLSSNVSFGISLTSEFITAKVRFA